MVFTFKFPGAWNFSCDHNGHQITDLEDVFAESIVKFSLLEA